ncbi:transcriptional repressor [Thalassotalea sp. M1531]|uniref:Transcriptional repressor n=1 Tax=Thalassotalea algicola TaxID=2716224 RepID=A0A7Y0LC98_9GAMM|nr:transcriptional repressor [Thalassotalea algicola]NMP31574.1 transcriptional repressor [Thalassotalea algicola]
MKKITCENSTSKLDVSLKKAAEHCHRHGSKLTLKRKQVLSILIDAGKAISAYELIDLFESICEQKIPPMSAYRILDYLVSVDLVHKINLANKFVACAHIGCKSHHEISQLLFCQQCQRVEEVPVNSFIYKSFKDEINNFGYQLDSQQIELGCICNACSSDNVTSNKNFPALTQG